MNNRSLFVLFLIVSLVSLTSISVQAAPQISGELLSKLGVVLEDSYNLSAGQEVILNLDESLSSGAVHLKFKGDYKLPEGEWALDLDEAYLDYYAPNFDFRLGKQRLNWGTALQLNPTDVINPSNINDPLGEKLPVYLLNLDYYLSDTWQVTGVYAPFFTPAIAESPNPMIQLVKPENTFKNGEFAIKLSAMALQGMDFSLSFYHGKEKTPTPIIKPGEAPKAIFRDVNKLGADYATTIGDVGLWAEGSVNLPKDGDKNFEVIVGADYGFDNGLKIVSQFVHRSEGDKTNIILGGLNQVKGLYEWQLGGVYNITAKGLMLNPEFSYSLADATVFTAGLRYFKDSIGILPNEENQVYSQVSVSF